MHNHAMRQRRDDQHVLRQCRLFAGLAPNEFERLTRDYRVLALSAGRALFEQGSPADAFFVVLEGWVVLFRDQANGNRVVIHLFGPGDSFAEALILPHATYPASAEAACPLRVARFETKAFRTSIMHSPGLALAVIAGTFKQLHALVDRIEHSSEWSPRRRVGAFLLKMCCSNEATCRFELPVEQRLIAARLSMTPSTFSRTLAKLRTLGVEARRGQILIQDVQRLARFVAGEKP
jgi:CRP/FNR family transcriptional regulator, dissimilatory nitrate respiration regulator